MHGTSGTDATGWVRMKRVNMLGGIWNKEYVADII